MTIISTLNLLFAMASVVCPGIAAQTLRGASKRNDGIVLDHRRLRATDGQILDSPPSDTSNTKVRLAVPARLGLGRQVSTTLACRAFPTVIGQRDGVTQSARKIPNARVTNFTRIQVSASFGGSTHLCPLNTPTRHATSKTLTILVQKRQRL